MGRIQLDKLTPADVRRMLNRKLGSGQSSGSVIYHRAVLRSALATAVRDGLVPRNVAALADPVPHEPTRGALPFDEDEARRFLAAASGERLEALWTVALALGLRRGEALGLKWRDGDFDSGTLTIRQAVQRVAKSIVVVPPKTKASMATLPLSDRLVSTLHAHRARQLEEQLQADGRWHDEGWVSTDELRDKLKPSHVTHTYRRLAAKAGLAPRRFYDLRHSCGTVLALQGVPAEVIMRVLRHTKITTTMVYVKVLAPGLRKASASMDELLWGG